MTHSSARSHASRSLPATALVVVIAASTACSGKRPTFAKPQVQDAGGSGDITGIGDAAASDEAKPDVLGPPDVDGSATDTEGNTDSGGGDDDTTSSLGTATTDVDEGVDDTEPAETSEGGPDVDAGPDNGATSGDGSAACSEGRYAADNGECQQWTECALGTYVASTGTADSDQECQPCEPGTYSDAANATACIAWDDCGWFDTSQTGTSTRNVECLQADTFHQFGTEGYDGIYAMANDTSGRVVVAGWTGGALYEDADGPAFVRLYDPEGRVVWTRQFGAQFQDRVTGVAFAPDGDVFIAGAINGVAVGDEPDPSDAFVARLASLNGLEARRWKFGTSVSDASVAIATDASGASVVVGDTSGALSGTSYGDTDVFVRQYDSTGEVHWTRQFGTTSRDYASAVAIGPSGEVAVVGSTSGALAGDTAAGGSDGFLRVYTTDGSSHRTLQFGTDAYDTANAISFTPDGNILVAGQSLESAAGGSIFLRLYRPGEDGALTLVWAHSVVSSASRELAASVSPSGNITIAGYSWEPLWNDVDQSEGAFVQQYDVRGDWVSGRYFGADGISDTGRSFPRAVATVGAEERVLVTGHTHGVLAGTNAGKNDAFVGFVALPPQVSQ